jgi:glycosyl hydrolase family 2
MDKQFEIVLGDVTDMEAHVIARYTGPSKVNLRGQLRGPFCSIARTLPATFGFGQAAGDRPNSAEAVVTDPCLWSPEMPHLYQVDIEALDGERIVAEYHGTIGLERLAPRRPVDFAPGTG